MWPQLKHFNEDEAWGIPSKMNGGLLLALDAIVDHVGSPFTVHCGYATGGHSALSQHYEGNAVDGSFRRLPIRAAYQRLIDALHDLQLVNRVGLGLYLEWNNQGFHIDLRGRLARWAYLGGKQVALYMAVDRV